ncbi:MAG TPA: flagellar basal body-associated protein FliL [Firmicutes bacterium]|nr:flagellar basal body-associated protein FliL [Bacillota bacterium]
MARKVEVDLRLLIVAAAFLILAAVGSAFVTVLMVRSGAEARQDSPAADTAAKREIGPTSEIGEFILNLSSKSGQPRFIKTDIVLETKDRRTISELEKREPQIRDRIITLIRSKTGEELNNAAGQELLRLDIKNSLNDLLLKGEVTNVFFVDFIIQ